METNIRLKLKKTASGVGFFVVSIILAMNIISVILAVPAYLRAPTISNSLMSLLQLIASITGMFIIGLFYCLLSKTSLNEVLPFKKVKPDLMIKTVVMALAVVFVANYLTDYFVQGMSLFGLHNNVSMSFESHNVVDNILYIISVAIIPALTEEFAFRGIILHKLRKYGDAYAVFISALLFGLLHGNIVQIPFAFTVGIAVGFITIKTGSILPAIIVHFLNNLTSVIVSVIGENNLCDPALTDAVYLIFVIIIFVGGILSSYSLSKIKGFFNFEAYTLIPFKERLKLTFSSIGIILALILMGAEIVYSLLPVYGT